ncbi:bacteriohemerythrin [bacterium]|nr:bacteriohemerythrin [bacterium]
MPDKIEWKKEYEIGVSQIDTQHKKLVDLLERLRLSLPNGLQNPMVGSALKEIVEYTQTHFRDEETLMRGIRFADLDRHAILHKVLLGEVAGILKKLKAGEDYNALDLLQFLKHWLVDHIIKEDSRIGAAYREAVSSVTSLQS